jgi:cystathionine beta-lyase/cystathionine gamma-synthase
METPTNPMLTILDIKAIKALTPSGVIMVVDNTFASPYLQNPLDMGADICLHSGTKYLGGHSDVIAGCVMLNDEKLAADIKFVQKSVGAVPGPFDVFLVMRGVKTLPVRILPQSRFQYLSPPTFIRTYNIGQGTIFGPVPRQT